MRRGQLMKYPMKQGGVALCLVVAIGCEDSAAVAPPPWATAPAAAPSAAAGGAAAAAAAEEKAVAPLQDSDFVESDGNRDPFRNYADAFKGKAPTVAQRSVLMPNTPIEAMRLIAIISGVDQPRAMLLDEKGVGHVTTRGDFVGRAEVVQSGGAENLAITINWRVDRIRDKEVVLAREDPSGPNRPPLTRIIPLDDKADDDST